MSFSMSRDDIPLLGSEGNPHSIPQWPTTGDGGATQRAILLDCKTSVGSGFGKAECRLNQRYQKYNDRRENQYNPDQGREAGHGSIEGNRHESRLVPALIPALSFHFDHSATSPRTSKLQTQ